MILSIDSIKMRSEIVINDVIKLIDILLYSNDHIHIHKYIL